MKIGVYFRETDPQAGGSFTFESSLVETLISKDFSTPHDIAFLGPEGELLERARRSGYAVTSIPTRLVGRLTMKAHAMLGQLRARTRTLSAGMMGNSLETLVRDSQIDVLWSLEPVVPSMEIPYWVTVWDLQHRKQPWFPEVSEGQVWKRREDHYSQVLRRATRVIVGNAAGRSELELFYQVPPERIVCAPQPVPRWVHQVDESPVENLPFEHFVLYPARFWPHKNHVALLEAMRLLEEEGENIGLVLVGSDAGNLAYTQRVIMELNLTHRVRIEGFVEREQLAYLYRHALAVAYVSLFGPENLPPLESFAFGTPVIAGNVDGAAEQFGEAALLVDPTDPRDIAQAIRSIYTDEETRRRLVADGHRIAEQRTTKRFIETVLCSIDEFEAIRSCWPGS